MSCLQTRPSFVSAGMPWDANDLGSLRPALAVLLGLTAAGLIIYAPWRIPARHSFISRDLLGLGTRCGQKKHFMKAYY